MLSRSITTTRIYGELILARFAFDDWMNRHKTIMSRILWSAAALAILFRISTWCLYAYATAPKETAHGTDWDVSYGLHCIDGHLKYFYIPEGKWCYGYRMSGTSEENKDRTIIISPDGKTAIRYSRSGASRPVRNPIDYEPTCDGLAKEKYWFLTFGNPDVKTGSSGSMKPFDTTHQ